MGRDRTSPRPLQSRAVEPLRRPPIAFAHRGGRAHRPENTIEAFRHALELGATGLESDAWLTADDVVVLDHDGWASRRGLRRRRIAEVRRSALPPQIPTLADLYEACGTDFELCLDIRDPQTAEATVEVARAAGPAAPKRLWLCQPDAGLLARWRSEFPDVRLVNSTRVRDVKGGMEKRAAVLAASGVDAVNLHRTEWSGGLVALVHRFERLAFGWDAQHERELHELVRMGIDAVFSDHVDRLMAVLGPDDAGGAG